MNDIEKTVETKPIKKKKSAKPKDMNPAELRRIAGGISAAADAYETGTKGVASSMIVGLREDLNVCSKAINAAFRAESLAVPKK